jgi:hypothetical protein
MNPDKIKILANSIAGIADVMDVPFEDVLTDLVDIGTIYEGDAESVKAYMESR